MKTAGLAYHLPRYLCTVAPYWVGNGADPYIPNTTDFDFKTMENVEFTVRRSYGTNADPAPYSTSFDNMVITIGGPLY